MIKYVFGVTVRNILEEEECYRIELQFGKDDTIICWLDEVPDFLEKGKKIRIAGKQLRMDKNNKHVAYMY